MPTIRRYSLSGGRGEQGGTDSNSSTKPDKLVDGGSTSSFLIDGELKSRILDTHTLITKVKDEINLWSDFRTKIDNISRDFLIQTEKIKQFEGITKDIEKIYKDISFCSDKISPMRGMLEVILPLSIICVVCTGTFILMEIGLINASLGFKGIFGYMFAGFITTWGFTKWIISLCKDKAPSQN